MNGEEYVQRELQYTLTKHAERRRQQRGIPYSSLETMLWYGKKRRRGDAYLVYMDKYHRNLAQTRLDPELYRQVVDKLDFYLVYDDRTRTVITVAHRLERLKWKTRRKTMTG